MRLLGLPPKLRLAPLWPALAAVVTATVFLWILQPGLLERSSAVQLLDTLRILTPVVAEARAQPGRDLQGWVRTISAEGGLRVTVVESDGKVIADSSRTAEQLAVMENHAERPEIRSALATGEGVSVRRSATTGRLYVYAARTATDASGRLIIVRLAEPLSHLQALRSQIAASMLLAALAGGVAILLISLWIDRRVFRPFYRLVKGASDVASGRARRVEIPDEEELAALALALNRLAETAEAQFAAVRGERDQLKAILASMSEGVLVVGSDGRALLANPAFFKLFHLSGEVTGQTVLEMLRQPELARIVDETLRLGQPQGGQIELQTPERRTLLLASAALAGGERGAVVVARDTTELTRVADMRRDFVGNVSHELKTPLAAIRGFAETLRDGALDEPPVARRFTDRILEQSRRLQALLDDLLTLTRLETVALREREPVDLGDLVRHAAETLAPMAREKNVQVEVEAADVPAVLGEADAIERLVLNLLENAIKYNRPEGQVKVHLSTAGPEALLEVTDTGIGIPPESLPRIFERFYRVDKGRAREEGGTGLGLAIVKHVAQAHGGQVEVDSRLGRGTTFRVRLPAQNLKTQGLQRQQGHQGPGSRP
ncbi:MAG TPA: ATP-binding protein [Thermoanaerobaculia bacterium]|nr:ATP-binding protein [Thermoanaerobaculia bacterium]